MKLTGDIIAIASMVIWLSVVIYALCKRERRKWEMRNKKGLREFAEYRTNKAGDKSVEV